MTRKWIHAHGGEISAPGTVEPGGTITITVTGDVDVVSVGIAGQGLRDVQVTNGEAQA